MDTKSTFSFICALLVHLTLVLGLKITNPSFSHNLVSSIAWKSKKFPQIFTQSSLSLKFNKYDGFNLPDPIIHPQSCGRKNKNMSFICDPANLLSKEEADSIDAILQEIRETATHKCGNGQVGYPIDIAILPANSGNNSSIATDLLKIWTISNSGCDDGIILVYLQSENRVSVRWGSGVEPALNVMIYPELISEIDQVLQEKSLGAGLYHAISLIRKQLKGNIGPPRRLPQLLVLAIIGGITVLGFGALVATAISEFKPQRSQSRLGRRNESQQILNRIQKMIKTGRLDTDLCPLTLLDLNRSGIPYVVSNKGYRFEARAYTLWMQTNRCGPETDPLTEAIKKNEYIMSTKDDVPPELRKLPIKVYLESLMRIYPDIITEQNIRDFLRNTDRWILP